MKHEPELEIIPDPVLHDLIAENEKVFIDDDISIMVGFEGIPQPFAATESDGIIKREEDPVSNNIPFDHTIN